MPTLRLGDTERSSIMSNFTRVLSRAANNKQFPLTEDDITEFGYSMLEPRIAKYYEFLRDEATDLTSASMWNPSFKVRDAEHVYVIAIHQETLPKDGLLLTDDHAMYGPILKWSQEQWAIENQITEAERYLYHVVENCCSMGQIYRVIPDDVLRFVPEYMQKSLRHAERRSRWPSSLENEPDKLNQLANALALGSISPDERVGIDTTLTRSTI